MGLCIPQETERGCPDVDQVQVLQCGLAASLRCSFVSQSSSVHLGSLLMVFPGTICSQVPMWLVATEEDLWLYEKSCG